MSDIDEHVANLIAYLREEKEPEAAGLVERLRAERDAARETAIGYRDEAREQVKRAIIAFAERDAAIAQADKLAEALRFYADELVYSPSSPNEACNDEGDIARTAIAAYAAWKGTCHDG